MTQEHAYQDELQGVITAVKELGEQALDLILIISGRTAAGRGISPAMQSRKAVHAHDLDGDNAAHVYLSPVSFPTFRHEVELLKTAGYAPRKSEQTHMPCVICESDHLINTTFEERLPDGSFNCRIYRDFLICASCFHVTESFILPYPEIHRKQQSKEAVIAHTEGQTSDERITAAHHDTSSVGTTAPKPNRSSAASELYAAS